MSKRPDPGEGYRLLKRGEVIKETDQFFYEGVGRGRWVNAICVGDEYIPGHHCYQRRPLIEPPSELDRLRALNAQLLEALKRNIRIVETLQAKGASRRGIDEWIQAVDAAKNLIALAEKEEGFNVKRELEERSKREKIFSET